VAPGFDLAGWGAALAGLHMHLRESGHGDALYVGFRAGSATCLLRDAATTPRPGTVLCKLR